MIFQKVRIAKQSTEDGGYEIKASVGTETWVVVRPSTISYRRNPRSPKGHLSIALEEKLSGQDVYIPVELLEFTNEFKTSELGEGNG